MPSDIISHAIQEPPVSRVGRAEGSVRMRRVSQMPPVRIVVSVESSDDSYEGRDPDASTTDTRSTGV